MVIVLSDSLDQIWLLIGFLLNPFCYRLVGYSTLILDGKKCRENLDLIELKFSHAKWVILGHHWSKILFVVSRKIENYQQQVKKIKRQSANANPI